MTTQLACQHSRCVSLGSDCQVGWQIRQVFDEPIASPFDWIVTPFDALQSILADRGARFGKSVSLLPAHPPFTPESTICDAYGCSYHHDFEHDVAGRPIVDEESLKQTRGKMLHKWRAFEETVSSYDEMLFVHLGSFKHPPFAWPYIPEKQPLLSSSLNMLHETLARLFPGTTCRLLQVTYPATTPYHADEALHPLVDLGHLELLPDLNWQGDAESWKRLLSPYDTYDRRFEGAALGDGRPRLV